jgi:hypothetical protein
MIGDGADIGKQIPPPLTLRRAQRFQMAHHSLEQVPEFTGPCPALLDQPQDPAEVSAVALELWSAVSGQLLWLVRGCRMLDARCGQLFSPLSLAIAR